MKPFVLEHLRVEALKWRYSESFCTVRTCPSRRSDSVTPSARSCRGNLPVALHPTVRAKIFTHAAYHNPSRHAKRVRMAIENAPIHHAEEWVEPLILVVRSLQTIEASPPRRPDGREYRSALRPRGSWEKECVLDSNRDTEKLENEPTH